MFYLNIRKNDANSRFAWDRTFIKLSEIYQRIKDERSGKTTRKAAEPAQATPTVEQKEIPENEKIVKDFTAKIAMIAITTKSSIKVNPFFIHN